MLVVSMWYPLQGRQIKDLAPTYRSSHVIMCVDGLKRTTRAEYKGTYCGKHEGHADWKI
jgi:hypothetical protein